MHRAAAFLAAFFFALGAIATTAFQRPQTVSPGQVITLTWSATTIPDDTGPSKLEVAMAGDTFSGWLALASDVDPRAGTASFTVPDALSGTYTVALLSPSDGKVAVQYGPFVIGDAPMHDMAEGTETVLPVPSRTAHLSSVPASKSASQRASAKPSSLLSAHQSSSHRSATSSSSKSGATTSARTSATSSTTSQFQSSTSTVYASGYTGTGYPNKNAAASAAMTTRRQGCGFMAILAILASTLVTFACS